MPMCVQLGITPLCSMEADGPEEIEPLLRSAQRRGLRTAVVASPAEFAAVRALGLRARTLEVSVARLGDAQAVIAALERLGLSSDDLILPACGFTGSTSTAYDVAAHFRAQPARGAAGFYPIDKLETRRRLVGMPQPDWAYVDLEASLEEYRAALARIGVPAVLKLTSLAGGDGIVFLESAAKLEQAIATLRCTARRFEHFPELSLSTVLLERYVDGQDRSVQGVVVDGETDVFTVCEKVAMLSHTGCFVDRAYLMRVPSADDAALVETTRAAIAAVGYRNGPFHIDFSGDGDKALILEIDYRLSAPRLTEAVAYACGRSWADATIGSYAHERSAIPRRAPTVIGWINRDESMMPLAGHPTQYREDDVRIRVRRVRRVAVSEHRLTTLRQIIIESEQVDAVRRCLESFIPDDATMRPKPTTKNGGLRSAAHFPLEV
jgi:biotin carboxylase